MATVTHLGTHAAVAEGRQDFAWTISAIPYKVCRVAGVAWGTALILIGLATSDAAGAAAVVVGGVMTAAAALWPTVRPPLPALPTASASVIRLGDPSGAARPVDQAIADLQWWLDLVRDAAERHDQLPPADAWRAEADPGPHEIEHLADELVTCSQATRLDIEATLATALRTLRSVRRCDRSGPRAGQLRLVPPAGR